jgi:hypothetical protein
MQYLNHNNISYIKSGIRILAGAFLISGNLLVAGITIILAELLGILEEIV